MIQRDLHVKVREGVPSTLRTNKDPSEWWRPCVVVCKYRSYMGTSSRSVAFDAAGAGVRDAFSWNPGLCLETNGSRARRGIRGY